MISDMLWLYLRSSHVMNTLKNVMTIWSYIVTKFNVLKLVIVTSKYIDKCYSQDSMKLRFCRLCLYKVKIVEFRQRSSFCVTMSNFVFLWYCFALVFVLLLFVPLGHPFALISPLTLIVRLVITLCPQHHLLQIIVIRRP